MKRLEAHFIKNGQELELGLKALSQNIGLELKLN